MDKVTDQEPLENEEELWEKVRSSSDKDARNKLIEKYHWLARRIAAKQYSMRIDDDVEFDDFLQYAELGLIESIDRYDPSSIAMFKTYATYRIKGSILSGIEKHSEKREQIAFRKRYLNDRVRSLTKRSSKAKHEDTFAELVDLTVGMAIAFMLDGTSQIETKSKTDLDLVYENNALDEITQALLGYVDLLAEREQLVIRSHYFEQVGFDELASILGVTKGRVSQIHKSAILSLKRHFEKNSQLDSYY